MAKKKVTSYKLKPWLTESGLLTIQGWARDGLTNEQISYNIGINPKTLYDWMKKYPEIAEALALGKEVVDREVENALLKRALGYEYEEIKEEVSDDGFKRTVITKQVAPDVAAIIFWLKNRKPDNWRDKQDINHSGENGGPIKINIVPDDGEDND